MLFTCIKSWFFRNHLADFHQISHWSFCWNVIDSLFKWSCSIDCQAHIFFFKTKNCSNDDIFISCDDSIGKMLHNIRMSAVAMSLRWVNRGPWASCLYLCPSHRRCGEDCFWDWSGWHQCKTPCPFCNLNTLWNILMIFSRNVGQDKTSRIQDWQLWLSYLWSYHPLFYLKKISCPLCNSNTLWSILMVLGRNVEQDQTTCCVQELWISQKKWPQSICRSLRPILVFHGPVIMPYISKCIW